MLAEPKKANQAKVRVVIRVTVPELSVEKATEIYLGCQGLVGKYPTANVELSLIKPGSRR